VRDSRDTLIRLLEMLRCIPRHPKRVTVSELRSRLQSGSHEVTARTIERDLIALEGVFPLDCDDRSKPHGWCWARGAAPLDIPHLTTAEALAFKLVEQHLGSLLPASMLAQLGPYIGLAERRIQSEDARGAKSWVRKIRTVPAWQPLLPPKIDLRVQEDISEALLHGRQVNVRYRRHGEGDAHSATIHPLAIVQRGPVTYLACRFFNYPDVRLLALHRVEEAQAVDESAKPPAGFDIDASIASGMFGFGDGKAIRLEAEFAVKAAAHLSETPLSTDQKLVPIDAEHVKLVATVPNTQQLFWWLLAFGDNVEVIKPASLRREIARALKQAAAHYSDD
jgi:predicted DNA-binding transcriptional regulator YafY